MIRRSLLFSAALIVPTFARSGSLVSVQGTPGSPVPQPVNPFADLDLPELAITVTAGAIEGLPPQLPAGRYILSVTGATATPESGVGSGVVFLQVPSNMTTDSLLDAIAETAAMPAMMDESSPSWMVNTSVTGGPYARNDETVYADVDLAAGSWVLWTEDPNAPQRPVPVTVTGEASSDPPTPVSDVRIELDEFFYAFSNDIAAGPLILEVANVGTLPHFIALIRVSEDTTVEDIQALVAGTDGALPAPVGNLAVANVEQVFAAGDQSDGVTAWYATSLSAGTYAAVCFMTSLIIDGSLTLLGEQGASHTLMGMVAIIEVTESRI